MLSPALIIALFVGGGLGLSACNQIHVEAGVLSYPNPGPLDVAWWAPLLFGVAALVICAGAVPFARRLREPGTGAFVSGTLWFTGAYAASGIFDGSPEALAAAYALAWAARVAIAEDRLGLAAFSLLLAAGGGGAEAALVAADTFEYAREDLLGVPIWLPGLYLHGAPLALAVTRRFLAPHSPASLARV